VKYGRVPWWSPEEFTSSQRAYYDKLTAGPRKRSDIVTEDGRLKGPFHARLIHPELGTALQELAAVLRFKTPALSDRQRELIILETARHEKGEYEWWAHSRHGLAIGLQPEELEAVLHGSDLASFDAAERLTRDVVKALLEERDLDDELYERAEATLGLVAIFDIIALVGHYQHTALATAVWRVPLPPGARPAFASRSETASSDGDESVD